MYVMHKIFSCTGILKHWQLSWFSFETFITFMTFRFSTRGERHTIFTMLTVRPASGLNSLTQPTRVHPAANNWTRLGPNCSFWKITQNPQPIASGNDVIHIPSPISYPGFLLWHLWLSHLLRASANTCVNVCTYPWTKPKSSKPN